VAWNYTLSTYIIYLFNVLSLLEKVFKTKRGTMTPAGYFVAFTGFCLAATVIWMCVDSKKRKDDKKN